MAVMKFCLGKLSDQVKFVQIVDTHCMTFTFTLCETHGLFFFLLDLQNDFIQLSKFEYAYDCICSARWKSFTDGICEPVILWLACQREAQDLAVVGLTRFKNGLGHSRPPACSCFFQTHWGSGEKSLARVLAWNE